MGDAEPALQRQRRVRACGAAGGEEAGRLGAVAACASAPFGAQSLRKAYSGAHTPSPALL